MDLFRGGRGSLPGIQVQLVWRKAQTSQTPPSMNLFVFFCRRWSLLGGYKAHSEAIQEFRRGQIEAAAGARPPDPAEEESLSTTNPRKRSRTHNSVRKSRRLSEAPRESERMPGAGLAGGGVGQAGARGGSGGEGGLARCQRVWKMVPPDKDKRPTWLRQYEVQRKRYSWPVQTVVRASRGRVYTCRWTSPERCQRGIPSIWRAVCDGHPPKPGRRHALKIAKSASSKLHEKNNNHREALRDSCSSSCLAPTLA